VQNVILLSHLDQIITLKRHWNREEHCTELCKCDPVCHSMREDHFAQGIAKLPAEGNQWCLVCVQLTPANLTTLEIACKSGGLDWDTQGLHFTWVRRCKDANSPAIIHFKQQAVITQDHSFDLGAAVAYHTRISTDFFGGVPGGDSTTSPIVDSVPRQDMKKHSKPRLRLGVPQKK